MILAGAGLSPGTETGSRPFMGIETTAGFSAPSKATG